MWLCRCLGDSDDVIVTKNCFKIVISALFHCWGSLSSWERCMFHPPR